MLVEHVELDSLVAVIAEASKTLPVIIHRYKGRCFSLRILGDSPYLLVADRSIEKPYIEYNLKEKGWKAIDPSEEEFSDSPDTVVIPVVDSKGFSGKLGKEVKEALKAS